MPRPPMTEQELADAKQTYANAYAGNNIMFEQLLFRLTEELQGDSAMSSKHMEQRAALLKAYEMACDNQVNLSSQLADMRYAKENGL